MEEANRKTVQVTGERNISLHIGNPAHYERICKIGNAISSKTRLQILNILKDASMSVQELAAVLNQPLSSTSLNVRKLEDAGLLITEMQPGRHGSSRICTASMHAFTLLNSDNASASANNALTLDMPVGNYYEWEIEPTCGLADENGVIDGYDDVRTFYSPARLRAQLLWFHQGYIEYRFPNIGNPLLSPKELSFQMEICSEAPGFLENWPSDISISVNGCTLGTYCCPGDFGARRGRITPACWANGRTQYGILKTFSVRGDGSYIDGCCVGRQTTLARLHLPQKPYISLRIEIRKDAQNIGGINIFGEKYGDYPQGIVMTLSY